MKLKDKGLELIEALVSDDICQNLDFNIAMNRESALSQKDIKILGHKLGTIYRISHALREDAICYEAHDDWRKEINNLYRKYKRANII